MIKAIGNRIVVKVLSEEEEVTPGGFVKAQGARKDKPLRGEVVSIGDEVSGLIVGSIVYVASYGYDEIGEYILVPSAFILGLDVPNE